MTSAASRLFSLSPDLRAFGSEIRSCVPSQGDCSPARPKPRKAGAGPIFTVYVDDDTRTVLKKVSKETGGEGKAGCSCRGGSCAECVPSDRPSLTSREASPCWPYSAPAATASVSARRAPIAMPAKPLLLIIGPAPVKGDRFSLEHARQREVLGVTKAGRTVLSACRCLPPSPSAVAGLVHQKFCHFATTRMALRESVLAMTERHVREGRLALSNRRRCWPGCRPANTCAEMTEEILMVFKQTRDASEANLAELRKWYRQG
jgi:hypothetical protein